ncbi:hypothetical protein ACQ4M4_07795 [Leptolyngbya sp. AN02str]|uniref:hypothetical protein n=1 Tax=Leptolyngbya sp. AN02str TaxID=3423363 RepID=UPI003D31AF64
MEATLLQNQLELLSSDLQQGLHTAFAPETRLLIRCAIKNEQLLVLVQHPANVSIHCDQVFSTLEALLYRANALGYLTDLQPEGPSAQWVSVRLFLRLTGQHHPYVAHRLTLKPTQVVLPNAADDQFVPPAPADADSPWVASEPVDDAEMQQWMETAIAPDGASSELPEPDTDSLDPPLQTVKLHPPSDFDMPPMPSHPARSRGFGMSAMTAAGLAAIALVAGLGGYALSRPCVIGDCEPLQTAQRLNFEASRRVNDAASAQEVVAAYDQITDSMYLLSTIPSWSSRYEDAQALIQTYGANAQVIEKVVIAQQLAWSAAEKSQEPPHPLATWRDIQQAWRDAIAQLKQVQADSPVYDLARAKLVEYEGNLDIIGRRIRIELQAQERVGQARQTSKVAEAQDGIAQSVESLREATSTWQTAVSLLKDVPTTTMAYAEAQQLLALYEPQLNEVRSRLNQEQVAATNLDKAMAIAAEAQRSELRNQWSQAVGHWQEALLLAQQIPMGTVHYNQAQPLLSSYRLALDTAQDRLRSSVSLQSAMADMESICSGMLTICTYSRSSQGMQVRMTMAYNQAVEQAAGGQTLNSTPSSPQLNQMNPLLRAIAAVGKSSAMPIELYNADGSLFGVYDPRVDGYVPTSSP